MNTRRKGFMGWILGLIVALLILGAVAAFFGHLVYGAYPPYYYGPGYFPFGFFFPFGFIFFFLFVFILFRLVFWRGGWGWGPGRWGYRGYGGYWGDAKEVLRLRYARGEITKEQFDQMMRDLAQQQ